MEKPKYFGKNLDKYDEARARAYILNNIAIGRREKEFGEVKKTEKAIKLIQTLSQYVNELLGEMEMPANFEIKPEQVHFLTNQKFIKEENSFLADATHSAMGREININIEKLDVSYKHYETKLIATVLHEMIHEASWTMFHAKRKGKNKAKYSVYRQGYLSFNPKEIGHEHFRGLNEAIVDKITKEILDRKQEELTEMLSIDPSNWNSLKEAYESEIEILNIIISKISENQSKTKEEVWSQFKKGLFSGKILSLKEVEKTFGKGSLRVLAAMGTRGDFEENMNDEILQYFKSKSDKEKSLLANDILSERERSRYINRKNNHV